MPIALPGNLVTDIRDPIVGDSYNWEGLEPAAAKKTIVIHATASQAPNEDGFTMADYHVNHNGWGGIGVHFVVTKDNYPGRPGQTPAGAHIQYVGDLLSWRAGVANANPGKVHIEISGLFTPGNGVPSENQLRQTRSLIDYFISKNNVLPSINYYNQVSYHNAVAIQPAGATDCPGWQHPQFKEWFGYLQGGAEPSWWSTVAPATPSVAVPAIGVATVTADDGVNVRVAPNTSAQVTQALPKGSSISYQEVVTGESVNGNSSWLHENGLFTWTGATDYVAPAQAPAPVSQPVAPAPIPQVTPSPPTSVLDNEPEYKATYVADPSPTNMVTQSVGMALDMTGSGVPIDVPANRIINVVGHFTNEGKTYFRSDKSVATDNAHGTWYGLNADVFISLGATAVPVNVTKKGVNPVALSISKAIGSIAQFFKSIKIKLTSKKSRS